MRGVAQNRNRVAGLFGLRGDAWMRHANPASVWTRFAVLPLLTLAIWSRDWIGWWCLVPIVLLLIWLVVNPVFFRPPASTRHWASASVFGERIWTESDRDALPPVFGKSLSPGSAQTYQVVGLAMLAYGLVVLDAGTTVGGLLIVEGGKLWYLDRMALLFATVKQQNPTWAAWEY